MTVKQDLRLAYQDVRHRFESCVCQCKTQWYVVDDGTGVFDAGVVESF